LKRIKKLRPGAADLLAAAQKAHLAAFEQIGDRGGGFTGIAAATGDGEDEIAERKLGTMNFAHLFFHNKKLRLDWDKPSFSK
jgi:hypothetical protein